MQFLVLHHNINSSSNYKCQRKSLSSPKVKLGGHWNSLLPLHHLKWLDADNRRSDWSFRRDLQAAQPHSKLWRNKFTQMESILSSIHAPKYTFYRCLSPIGWVCGLTKDDRHSHQWKALTHSLQRHHILSGLLPGTMSSRGYLKQTTLSDVTLCWKTSDHALVPWILFLWFFINRYFQFWSLPHFPICCSPLYQNGHQAPLLTKADIWIKCFLWRMGILQVSTVLYRSIFGMQ